MAGLMEVKLRRMDTSQPWGFRMRGGAQQGIPLFVEHVGPKSRAGKAGLRPQDVIVEICKSPMAGRTHEDAKREILRAGNELDILVERNMTGAGMNVTPAPANMAAHGGGPHGGDQRAQICEESTVKFGGPTYKNVQPKTYQILEQELNDGHITVGGQTVTRDPTQMPTDIPQAPQPAPGPGPASIFNRNREDRSQYLQAQGQTIQRAYGETQ